MPTQPTGLKVFYPCNATSGNVVDVHAGADLTVSGPSLSNQTGHTYSNARGWASSSSSATSSSSALYTGTGDFTWAFWIKWGVLNQNVGTIFNHTSAASGIRLEGRLGPSMRATSWDGSTMNIIGSTISIADDTWYLVFMLVDRDGNHSFKLYNTSGSQVGSTQTESRTGSASGSWSDPLTITGNAGENPHFNSIMLFDHLLSQDEQDWVLNGGAGRTYTDFSAGPQTGTAVIAAFALEGIGASSLVTPVTAPATTAVFALEGLDANGALGFPPVLGGAIVAPVSFVGVDADGVAGPISGLATTATFALAGIDAAGIPGPVIGTVGGRPELEGMLAFWRFEESAGNTRVDSHNGFDLVEVAGTVSDLGFGKHGSNALSLDSNSAYLENTDAGLHPGTGDLTVTFWFQHNNVNQSFTLMQQGDRNVDDGWDLQFAGSGIGQFRLTVTQDASSVLATHSDLDPDTWYFVSLQFDRDGLATLRVRDDIDGTPVDAPVTIDISTYTNPWTSSFQISGHAGDVPRVDSLSIWNRLLTETEITNVCNGGAGLDYPDYVGGGAAAVRMVGVNSAGLFLLYGQGQTAAFTLEGVDASAQVGPAAGVATTASFTLEGVDATGSSTVTGLGQTAAFSLSGIDATGVAGPIVGIAGGKPEITRMAAFFRFEESSSPRVDSLFGKQLVTTAGSFGSEAGKHGNAVVANVAGANMGDATIAPIGLGDFTVGGWVKFASTGAAYQNFWESLDPTTLGTGWYFRQGSFAHVRPFIVPTTGGGVAVGTGSALIGTTVWVWCQMRLQRGVVARYSIYNASGALITAEQSTDVSPWKGVNLKSGIRIVGGTYGPRTDSLGLWNRYLSDAELANVRNNGVGWDFLDFFDTASFRIVGVDATGIAGAVAGAAQTAAFSLSGVDSAALAGPLAGAAVAAEFSLEGVDASFAAGSSVGLATTASFTLSGVDAAGLPGPVRGIAGGKPEITGMVAFFRFEESSGTRYDSHYGQALPLTAGTFGVEPGRHGNAVIAADTAGILGDATIAPPGLGDYTIGGWFKAPGTSSTTYTIWSTRHPVDNNLGLRLRVTNSNRALAFIWDETTGRQIGGGIVGVTQGNWHWYQVRLDRDGLATNNIYRTDGTRVGSGESVDISDWQHVNLKNGLRVRGGTNPQFRYDSLGIWNRRLSDAEMASVRNNGVGWDYRDFYATASYRVLGVDATGVVGAVTGQAQTAEFSLSGVDAEGVVPSLVGYGTTASFALSGIAASGLAGPVSGSGLAASFALQALSSTGLAGPATGLSQTAINRLVGVDAAGLAGPVTQLALAAEFSLEGLVSSGLAGLATGSAVAATFRMRGVKSHGYLFAQAAAAEFRLLGVASLGKAGPITGAATTASCSFVGVSATSVLGTATGDALTASLRLSGVASLGLPGPAASEAATAAFRLSGEASEGLVVSAGEAITAPFRLAGVSAAAYAGPVTAEGVTAAFSLLGVSAEGSGTITAPSVSATFSVTGVDAYGVLSIGPQTGFAQTAAVRFAGVASEGGSVLSAEAVAAVFSLAGVSATGSSRVTGSAATAAVRFEGVASAAVVGPAIGSALTATFRLEGVASEGTSYVSGEAITALVSFEGIDAEGVNSGAIGLGQTALFTLEGVDAEGATGLAAGMAITATFHLEALPSYGINISGLPVRSDTSIRTTHRSAHAIRTAHSGTHAARRPHYGKTSISEEVV